MSREGSSQIFLIASAVLSIVIVVALVAGIIPSVAAEQERGGTPTAAVIAFWVDVVIFLAAGGLFGWFARTSGRMGVGRRTATCIAGVVILFIALCFLDAAGAYLGHGPDMANASRLLIVCAVAGGLAGLLAILQASWLARANREVG